MTIIVTDLGNTRERAKLLRYEPTAPFTATNVQDAIGQAQALPPTPVPTTAITFAMSPYTPTNADTVLLVNTSGGAVTVNMQPAASRLGSDITVKDDTGNAAANPISVVRNGAETIDGLTTYLIDSNYGAATFSPQTGGYFVKP